MKCPKCRVNLSLVDKYCPRCGEIFDHSDLERLTDTLENNLSKIYINKLGLKFNFSIEYLLFNFFYLFYLKQTKRGILVFAINTIFLCMLKIVLFLNAVEGLLIGFILVPVTFSVVSFLFINIYYFLNIKNIYMNDIKYRVQTIIKENGIKDIKLLYDLCEKDSKGNYTFVFLCLPLVIIIFGLLIFA